MLERNVWSELAGLAAALARETLAAEQELLQKPNLHKRLGLPDPLLRTLRHMSKSEQTVGPRVMRFDFHWTTSGWRISEANTDVASGFIEASGVTQLFAEHYPELEAAGDPAKVLCESFARICPPRAMVALLHLSIYSDDRQIMLYLARRLEDARLKNCLISPEQLRWEDRAARAECASNSRRIDAIFRFVPTEWLPRFWPRSGWEHFLIEGRTPACNPGYAILSQSKRFALVWDNLNTPLHHWRTLLPETRSPEVVERIDENWVLKPALGYEGKDVGIEGVSDPETLNTIRTRARKQAWSWAAQRRFEALPIHTPEGLLHPCLGVFVIDGHVAGAYGRMASRPLIDDGAREVVVLVQRRAVQEYVHE